MDHRVLVVDDDEDLRDALRDLIECLGSRCLSMSGVEELRVQRDAAMNCLLAIIDVNLGYGAPSGIDAYHWLRRERFGGGVVFLTGHAYSFPLVREASCIGDAALFGKPIAVCELRRLLREHVLAPQRMRDQNM